MSEINSPTDLAGEQISAVCFVQDYVEFHFDGPVLRALAPVTVAAAGRRWTAADAGYRDALCSVIGRVVSRAELEEGVNISVHLDGGAVITIPLHPGASPSGEAAHFLAQARGALQVW